MARSTTSALASLVPWGQDQVAAGGQRVAQRRDDLLGPVAVLDVVHDRRQQQAHGPVEVERPQHVGILQQRLRLAQVAPDHGRLALAGQQRPGVHEHHRITIDVDHPGPGSQLVHVAARGQARADVEELADAGPGEEPHRPAEERAAGPGRRAQLGSHLEDLLRRRTVGGEVVLAAEKVVVEPGHAGCIRIEAERLPLQPSSPDHELTIFAWSLRLRTDKRSPVPRI
ncbi:hypothetical protein HD593_009839 [Nonomuraea rubra]|uniref:Uncharacterized protein n=1 Tax=Nonomuraea rubra TaxID=46180 RepID=A0A7X0U4Z2_9ACTN|nr:hypothetical protein [Nonomuraea rubra]